MAKQANQKTQNMKPETVIPSAAALLLCDTLAIRLWGESLGALPCLVLVALAGASAWLMAKGAESIFRD